MAYVEGEMPITVGNPYPVMYGNCGNNGGFFGNDAIWAIILFALIFNGGWGNGGNRGYGSGPVYVDSNNGFNYGIQDGFNHQAVMGSLNGINSAISNGFANAEVSRCNAQANILQTLNANNNSVVAGINSLAMGLQNCCCENRAGLADLKYTIATENCADRATVSNGIRDVLAATQAQTQAILDKMCQQEIDAKNDIIANLRTQLNMADLKASQVAQNAFITQGFANEVDALYNRLNNCPVPTTPVYGRTPIFTCNGNGCGCQNVQ